MKKLLLMGISVLTALLLTACSNNENKPAPSAASNPSPAAYTNTTPSYGTDYNGPISMLNPNATTFLPTERVEIKKPYDIDLSGFSTTMTYAQLYNILVEPEKYVGTSIKIKGRYTMDKEEGTERVFHFLIASDEAACCELGIEFFVFDDKDIYPPDGSEIMLEGVIDVCNDKGFKFICLKTNRVDVLRNGPLDQGATAEEEGENDLNEPLDEGFEDLQNEQ